MAPHGKLLIFREVTSTFREITHTCYLSKFYIAADNQIFMPMSSLTELLP